MKKPEILILGGTTEARQLASLLCVNLKDKYDIVTSLAGVTQNPKKITGKHRNGGFGGIAGLTRYIKEHNVMNVIDATHPFAENMPFNAAKACAATSIPVLKLLRPAWEATEGDNWIEFPSLLEAAKYLDGSDQTAFLSVGSHDLMAFKELTNIQLHARMIEPPAPENIPQNCKIHLMRPPFTQTEEERLFLDLNIDIVVTKNSGAMATKAKLDACKKLDIPVLMIERPVYPEIPTVRSVEAVYDWLENSFKDKD